MKQQKYFDELQKYETKFKEIKSFLNHFVTENLPKKVSVIKSLSDDILLAEAERYIQNIKAQIKSVSLFIETNVIEPKKLTASDIPEKELDTLFTNLRDNLLKFIRAGENFEAQLKSFSQVIEGNLNKKISKENATKAAEEAKKLAAKTEKLEAEKKKLEQAKQEQNRLEEINLAKSKLAQEKIEIKNKVKSVNEDDKKGINHKNLTNYEATRNFFVKIQQDIEEPFKESSLKMYKFDLQKAVNFPLNSMLEDKCSDDNRRNFIEKIKTLIRLLNGYVKFYSCFK